MMASIAAASLPDIDFGLGFLAGRNLHHYFTHSVGATLVFTGAAYLASRAFRRDRPERDAMVLGGCYLSHLVLDLFSTDTAPPYGMQLFWPLTSEFYISPVLLFDDIWRGTLAKLLGLHNWLAVAREILIVGPPAFLTYLWWRRRRLAIRPGSGQA
jgi:membrane-bound metal-dependent hydrolase YbcI (DUF457 family)